VELLRSVRERSVEDVTSTSRRARYTAGRLADSGGADGREDRDVRRGCRRGKQQALGGHPFPAPGRQGACRPAERDLVRFRTVPDPQASGTAEADQVGSDRLWIGVNGPSDISLRLVGWRRMIPRALAR
jgi:hypothetical protein